MVTNNFYKWQRVNFVNIAPVLIDETGAQVTTQKPTSTYGAPCFVNGANAGGFKMLFGTSNTAPTAADYNLATVNENFTDVSFNAAITYEGEKTVITFTKVAQYTGEEAIEIKEAGLFKSINKSSSVSNYYLMAREVFATPVTVNNGETITVSISIKF